MVDDSAQVLGASYFGPVEGSPLIPPEAITGYFILFFILLALLYYVLQKRRKPVFIWHKVKLLVVIALVIKVVFFAGGALLASYWLLPAPSIQKTTPTKDASSYGTKNKIEIIFDRPVSRSSLEKSISPDVPGVWVFEDSLYKTHFYRKVTFYPTESLTPGTKYTITLSNIKNVLKNSKSYTDTFSFTTQPSPRVTTVAPAKDTKDIDIRAPMYVNLSNENDSISEFSFALEPAHEIIANLDATKKRYTLTPKTPLKQGTTYTLTIKKTDLLYNIPANTVIKRSNTTEEYKGSFATKEAPGIVQFTPSGTNISPTSQIAITFSQPMDRTSVEEQFSILPAVAGNFTWKDDQNVVFTPQKLSYETEYSIKVEKGMKAKGSGFFEEDSIKTFTTIGHVKVKEFSPSSGTKAVGIKNQVRVAFDQEVDKATAEKRFSLTPSISGTFSWEGNTLVFTPASNYGFSKTYTVEISPGIKSIRGLDSNSRFSTTFTTEEGTVRLAVPAYLQQHTLSCEAASLRMALAYKGVAISEGTILNKLGVDTTPHVGDVWGNPYNAFVGNVDGRQMVDGYGVYWGPIARVAKEYRNAQDFQGWSIAQLTQALSDGNPVVLWVYAGGGYQTSWNTPDGQKIFAYRDEHAVTAVGYVGPPDNPSQMIINDPLHGQVYWQRGYFDAKWASFGRAGVVVY